MFRYFLINNNITNTEYANFVGPVGQNTTISDINVYQLVMGARSEGQGENFPPPPMKINNLKKLHGKYKMNKIT